MAKGSNTFGGTLKLGGETEYKQALKNITSQLGVVSSEMSKVTATFGKSDKSVEGLTAKDEVLNKQLATQQQKVETLRGALELSKEQYGENDNKTLKWQQTLNKAEADLIKTTNEIDENKKALEEASKSTDDNTDKIKEFGKAEDDAGKKTLSLGDLIKANLISDAIKGGLQSLANGVKSVGSAMGSALTNGASYADDILTMSAQTGIATEELQKYKSIAELTDVPLETLTGSMAKMTKSLEANEDKYKSLGVSIRNADGSLKDNEDIFNDTIGALGKMTNETERDVMAMSLFGKKAQDLNPLIKLGADGLNELSQKAEQMGAVLSEEGLESLGKLDDEFQIFKTTASSTGNILASAFAPAITDVLGEVNNLGGALNNLMASVLSGDESAIDGALDNVSNIVDGLASTISEQAPKLIETAGKLIETLAKALGDNLPKIADAGLNVLSQLLSGLTSNLGNILPAIIQVVMKIAECIINNLPLILQAGVQVIVALVKGIADSLPQLIPTIINAVITMATSLLDNIDLIIDAGIQLLLGLAEGLINALPQLIEKIPVIIEKLVNGLVNNAPKLLVASFKLIVMLAKGLIQAIPQLLASIPKIIASIVKGFGTHTKNMLSVGKNLVKGIWNGISDATGWILDKIKGFGKSVLKGIKSIFGIHSPSTLFRDEVGKNLALGLGLGFENEMKNVSKEMTDAIPSNFDITPDVSAGFKSNKVHVFGDSSEKQGDVVFNATINNNSKYTSPADNVRLLRKTWALQKLKYNGGA